MSKFLSETGLKYFWEKIKTHLSGNYLSLDGGTTNKGAIVNMIEKNTKLQYSGFGITASDSSGAISSQVDADWIHTSDQSKDTGSYMRPDGFHVADSFRCNQDIVTISREGVKVRDTDGSDVSNNIEADSINITGEYKSVGLGVNDGVTVTGKEEGIVASITTDGLSIATNNQTTNPLTTITPEGTITTSITNNSVKDQTIINGSNLIVKKSSVARPNEVMQTEITSNGVSSLKFVKQNGTSSQVLLANGSIAILNAANGIPKLDANGKIPLSQLGNLDTTLFEVVTALPTTSIKKNRIYLLKSSTTATQNLYAEYVYTGDVNATYDASKWEKLGEYKANIDLNPYSKKDETIKSITFSRDAYGVKANIRLANNTDYSEGGVSISPATASNAGVMSASDKKALDTLTARYPLVIASFTASPSLVEVGASADITFTWTFSNIDFHPITAQGIVVDGAASVSVDKSTKSYKKTGLAGATTATTKSATLTVNGSLTKSVNVTYHYPTYIGVVANGTSITETVVKGLTKSIEWGKGKSATLTQSNQQIVYAYPASYGDLTSIKDGNGFEGFAGYTKSTLTVGGQTYNVYKQTLPATASSKYTFA